jgi:hypothetical protein
MKPREKKVVAESSKGRLCCKKKQHKDFRDQDNNDDMEELENRLSSKLQAHLKAY